MSMKRYIVDASKLSLSTCEEIYNHLENTSFIVATVPDRPGVYDVFWDSSSEIASVIKFPENCPVTRII